jgi:hypothetical protein
MVMLLPAAPLAPAPAVPPVPAGFAAAPAPAPASAPLAPAPAPPLPAASEPPLLEPARPADGSCMVAPAAPPAPAGAGLGCAAAPAVEVAAAPAAAAAAPEGFASSPQPLPHKNMNSIAALQWTIIDRSSAKLIRAALPRPATISPYSTPTSALRFLRPAAWTTDRVAPRPRLGQRRCSSELARPVEVAAQGHCSGPPADRHSASAVVCDHPQRPSLQPHSVMFALS